MKANESMEHIRVTQLLGGGVQIYNTETYQMYTVLKADSIHLAADFARLLELPGYYIETKVGIKTIFVYFNL